MGPILGQLSRRARPAGRMPLAGRQEDQVGRLIGFEVQALGLRLPSPFGVFIVVHVPFATSLKAFPW